MTSCNRDRYVVSFIRIYLPVRTTPMTITLGFDCRSWRSAFDTTCDNVCERHAIRRRFHLRIPASFNNKTDHHDIADILV